MLLLMILLLLVLLLCCMILYCCWHKKKNTFVKPAKYFKEKVDNHHLDYEYGKVGEPRNQSELIEELQFLLHQLVYTCCECKFVIMHGSLIGWYFNKRILPWDDDIDIIVLGDDVEEFVKYDNMQTKDWIIKVNPNYKNRDIRDTNNRIDARIISKKNGVFIDITFFWTCKDTVKAKDRHQFSYEDIFPLQPTDFENVSIVYVPNQVENVLKKEYGATVTSNIYKKWVFVGNEWTEQVNDT